VDVKAGQAMTEAAGGRAPTFDQAPIENFPLGTGSATNEPGLAAVERRAATTSEGNQPAVAIRQGQQQAIVEHATTPQPPTTQPAHPYLAPKPPRQLASGRMTPSAASGRLQTAFRNAQAVFKQEERRLWSKPTLDSMVHMPTVKQAIYNAGSKMPLRFRRAVGNHPGLRDTLEDLGNMPNNTSLADLNDVRSDILGISRTDADPMIRKIAGDLSDELLKAIESNPALRNNPTALADYRAARDFTKKMWDTIGQRPFQDVIKQGSDPRNVGGKLFGFGPQVTGERVPGGVAAITDALDNIRTQWLALGHTGFNPGVAEAAQRELGQGAVDYIINSMIRPIEASQTGAEVQHLNELVRWIDRNQGWLTNGRLLAPEQIDLLRAIRDSAEMGARVANLRGGRGSETAERLMTGGAHSRMIDIFSTILNKHLFVLGGGIAGHMIEQTTGLGIGALLGMSAEGMGQVALRRLYEMPAAQLQARLIEAAQNPAIARDLMKKAADFKNLSEETRRWFQALGAQLGAHTEHGLSPTGTVNTKGR
jgi:hypothetical protein